MSWQWQVITTIVGGLVVGLFLGMTVVCHYNRITLEFEARPFIDGKISSDLADR